MTADRRSIAIPQNAHQGQELAQSFDGENRRERRLLSGRCSIGIGPCARHFHWGAVGKTQDKVLLIGDEYFEFLVV